MKTKTTTNWLEMSVGSAVMVESSSQMARLQYQGTGCGVAPLALRKVHSLDSSQFQEIRRK